MVHSSTPALDGYPQIKPYEWWRRHDEHSSDAGLGVGRRGGVAEEAIQLTAI